MTVWEGADVSTKIVRTIDKVVIASVFAILLFCLFVLYEVFWPFHVMDIRSLEIMTPKVISGGQMIYRIDYCKDKEYDELQADVALAFVDHVVYNLSIKRGPLPSGCHVYDFIVEVPEIPAGKYRFEMLRTYSINNFRSVAVAAISKEFLLESKINNQAVDISVLINANEDLLVANRALVNSNKKLVNVNKQLTVDVLLLMNRLR